MSSRGYIDIQRERVEEALARMLPPAGGRPAVLHEAMRHAVLPGGKRIRPVMTLAASEAAPTPEGDPEAALNAAVAIELLHSYTLVHDDLPSMDNDLLRRGLPTVHAKFGEANAILAGDALQALAFATVSAPSALPPERAARLSRILAEAATGVVAGQIEDMAAAPLDEERLAYIQIHKTGDLFTAAMQLGAVAGGASEEDTRSLARYGAELGIAFQIIDDILDAPAGGGRPEPSSCLNVWTMDKAREAALFHTREAVAHLLEIPGSIASAALSNLAEDLVTRIQ